MINEANEQIKQNDRDITTHYEMQLYNTLRRLLGVKVEITKEQIRQMVKNVQERYSIQNYLEAVKKTIHNLDDITFIFLTK